MITRGYAAIGLDNPKTPANIGAALRACGCYRAAMMVLAGPRPVKLTQCRTDTTKTYKHMPLIMTEDVFDAMPHDCVPVAVDLLPEAQNLIHYKHPERAFYIFGAEDATLGARITDRCRDVIYVPTNRCMNLAATVNVVLYDRMVKREELK